MSDEGRGPSGLTVWLSIIEDEATYMVGIFSTENRATTAARRRLAESSMFASHQAIAYVVDGGLAEVNVND